MSAVCRLNDLVTGQAKRIEVDGTPVALVRIDDDVFAIADTCSHANISLSEGLVWCETRQIECVKHGSAFSLETGMPDTLPATQPVEVFNAKVVKGEVFVTRGAGK